jgi:hypothetical protein
VARPTKKNPGRALVTVSTRRGTDGGTITRTEQPVDQQVAPDAFAYGTNETGVVQTVTKERRKILETQIHPSRAGYFYDDKGRKIILTRQTVAAGTTVTALGGMIKIDVNPVDSAHSEQEVQRISGSTDGAGGAPATKGKRVWDERLKCFVTPWFITAAVGATPPEPGDAYPDADNIILRVEDGPNINDLEREQILWTVPRVIAPWVEYRSRGWAPPTLFDFLVADGTGFSNISEFNKPGVVFSQEAARADTGVCKVIHVPIHGRPDPKLLPQKFRVITPGVASAAFRISANTIHPGWTLASTTAGTLEIIPPSEPSFYRRGQDVILDVDCGCYAGRTYIADIVVGNELGFSDAAPGFEMVYSLWLAESPDGGFDDLTYTSRVVAVGQTGDSTTVHGRSGGQYVTDAATVDNYGPGVTGEQFTNIDMIEASVSSGTFDLAIRANGRAQIQKLTFTDNPTTGETFTTVISGARYPTPATETWTFRSVEGSLTITGGATLNGTNLNGTYLWDGGVYVGGQPRYVRGGTIEVFFNATQWRIRNIGTTSGYFDFGDTTNGPTTAFVAAVGTAGTGSFAGTPVIVQGDVFNPLSANQVLIGAALTNTLNNWVDAILLTEANAGVTYGSGTAASHYWGGASRSGINPDQIALTALVREDIPLTLGGTAQITSAAITTTGQNGALLVRVPLSSGNVTLYNRTKLRNPEYVINVPPSLVAAPSEAVEAVEATDTWGDPLPDAGRGFLYVRILGRRRLADGRDRLAGIGRRIAERRRAR